MGSSLLRWYQRLCQKHKNVTFLILFNFFKMGRLENLRQFGYGFVVIICFII